ncbi:MULTISPECIES: kelch repeat-containing protein [Paenibacillus]|uniref:Kelch repeat-containing protein n=1 Tax=Paenibacillus TaxID=44249 RepID=UPI0022B8D452|nr:kelch repeat-containing protein [Paenibacillus caseinilyticus]MCZ8519307.1 hypothetical protein [Paenibacillus caseinilyticus]
MSQARYGQGVERIGEFIYSVGGEDSSIAGYTAAVEAYDLTTNAWVKKADIPVPGVHLKTVSLNGLLYIIAGYEPRTGKPLPVQIYEPGTDQWTVLPEVVCDIYDPSVTVWDGKIVVAGGYHASGVTLDSVFTFDPNNGNREVIAKMPTPRFGHTAAVINHRLLIAGGAPSAYGAVKPTNEVLSYQFETQTWNTEAPLSTLRMHATSAVVQGKWVILGGAAQEVFGEVFSPGTNQWASIGTSELGNRNQPGVTPLGESAMMVIGGYRDVPLTAVEAIDSFLP